MGRAERIAGISGITAAVLFGVGSAIWGLDMPEDGTPIAEVLEWYSDTADRIVIGGSLSLLSIAAALVFAGAIRRVLADAEGDDVLATIAFGALVFALAVGSAAEGINLAAAFRAQDGELGQDLGQAMFELSQVFGSFLAAIGIGVFAIATAIVALRSGRVLPRWLAIFTLVLGIVLLTPVAHVNWVAGSVLVLLGGLIGGALLLRAPERVA